MPEIAANERVGAAKISREMFSADAEPLEKPQRRARLL
jgi:hypothetical protein